MFKQLLFLCALAFALNLQAQPEQEPIETVLVTASREPVDASRVGSTFTVIERADLDRRQIVYVADALRDVPGFAISRVGTLGSQTQVRVRGAEANQVMVFIDGVKANDPASGDEFLFEQLLATEIERIEIVRGPQSALWGSDALAGVINVITARGTTPFSANGFLESGSFGTTQVGGQISSARDAFEINAGLSQLSTDGSNISRTGAEDDGSQNSTANLNFRVQLSPQTRLEFFGRYTDSTTDFDRTDFVNTGLPADADRHTDATQAYLRAAVNTSFLDERWSHRFSVTQLETDNRNDDAGVSLGSTAAEKRGFYYQTSFALTDSDAHRLTFAVDREELEFSQRGPASFFGDPNQDQAIETTGYVLEYQGLELGAVSVSAAIRRDDNSDFDDIDTYRLTGSYAVPKYGTRLHASVGTGQKSPTFVDRFGFFATEFFGNPNLRPERSEGWEIGFEQPVLAGNATLSATYFGEQLEDEIDGFVFDAGTSLFTAMNRAGKSKRRGVELGLAATLRDNLELSGSYTYLDSTERDSQGNEVQEVRRPKNMFAVNLNFTPLPRANINLNVSYSGSQRDVIFPPFPQPSARVTLDSYILVSLSAAYRFSPNLELIGRIENLLDEVYEDVVGFRTPGVGAYIGIRVGR
jgi:vitamin B12 transporter